MTELTDAAPTAPELDTGVAADRQAPAPFRWTQISILGWVVGGLVLAQSLFFLRWETLAPEKAAFLLPLGALGLPFLFAMALGRAGADQNTMLKWGARFALAFLAWAGLSTLLAATPQSAFFGLYAQLTGWLFLLCVAGAWALGTRLSASDREVLELAIVASAVGNSLVALLQQHVGLGGIGLPLYPNDLEPTGMLGNPVFLGALLAGALALVAPRLVRSWWWAVVVVVIGLGLGVDGERLPFILAVCVVVVEIVWAVIMTKRDRHAGSPGADQRAGPGRVALMIIFGALALGSVVVGSITAGSNSPSVPVTTSAGQTAPPAKSTQGGVINHIQTSDSYDTWGERIDIWRVAWHAALDRPLVGYGPNQFRAATASRYSKSLVDALQLQVYTVGQFLDGHDLFVELAVTVGFVGLALFVVWLVFVLRRRRGPLLLFGLVLLASELAEPLNVVITPLAFLALGAAVAAPAPLQSDAARRGAQFREIGELVGSSENHGSSEDQQPDRGFWARWSSGPRSLNVASVVLAAVASVFGILLVVGDVALSEGTVAPPATSAARSDAATAESLLSPWPDPAALLAKIDATPEALAIAQSADWYQAAVSRDDTNALYLELLATTDLSAGNMRAGNTAAAQAVAAEPWNASALDLLGAIDQTEGKEHEARQLYRSSLSYLPGQSLIEAFLSGQCRPALPGSSPYQPLALGCARTGS